MSHNVHPYAHRLVNLRDWKSRWFANPKKFKELLRADTLIREHLEKRLRGSYIADIEIERSRKATRVIISTSRPGMVIGRSGEGAAKLKKDLLRFMNRNDIAIPEDFKIDITDTQNPDSNAMIVAAGVAEALEKRMPFRRVMKQTIEKVMGLREVQGAKITLSGRLGGAEMSRKEELKKGGIPLQFIRGDIDFARYQAHLPYGVIGIKIWIYKGDSLEQKDK